MCRYLRGIVLEKHYEDIDWHPHDVHDNKDSAYNMYILMILKTFNIESRTLQENYEFGCGRMDAIDYGLNMINAGIKPLPLP